jgi:hypothetical protein
MIEYIKYNGFIASELEGEIKSKVMFLLVMKICDSVLRFASNIVEIP